MTEEKAKIEEYKQSLAVVLAYASGSNYSMLKRWFGTLQNGFYDKMEGEDPLHKLNVLNYSRSQLASNYGTLQTIPFKLNFLQSLLGDKFEVLQTVKLPYQDVLFTDAEITNASGNTLSIEAIYNRLTEGVIHTLDICYSEILPTELDYKKLFMLDILQQGVSFDVFVEKYRKSRAFYSSSMLLMPVVDITEDEAKTIFEDIDIFNTVITTHFMVDNKSEATISSDFIDKQEEGTILQDVVTPATDLKSVIYVDTENIPFDTVLRLVSSIRTDLPKEKGIELRLYCNTNSFDYAEGWNLLTLEKENIHVELIKKDGILTSKSLIDFLIIMDVTMNKDKGYENIIVSNDSDFHVLVEVVPNIKIAYLYSKTSPTYVKYLKEENIENINIETLTTNGGIYQTYLKDLIALNILNTIITFPIKEWNNLGNRIATIITSETLIGERNGMDISELVEEEYQNLLKEVKIDLLANTVSYKETTIELM